MGFHANIAYPSPIGFDTIMFELKQEDCPEYDLLAEVPAMIPEIYITMLTDSYCRFKYRGLTFDVNSKRLKLRKGCLCTFYRGGSNLYPLLPNEVDKAVRKLRDFIPVPWERSFIWCFHLAINNIVNCTPVAYFLRLADMPKWTRLVPSKTQIVYTSSGTLDGTKEHVSFYDKSNKNKLENDVLRIEYKSTGKHHGKSCNYKVDTFQRLSDIDVYDELLDYVESKLDSITILKSSDNAIKIGSCNKEFFSSITEKGVKYEGYNTLLSKVEEAKLKGEMTPDRYQRAKRKLKDYVQASPETDKTSDIGAEIITNYKELIADSKQFIRGSDIPRFKEWISLCQDGGGE